MPSNNNYLAESFKYTVFEHQFVFADIQANIPLQIEIINNQKNF